MGHDPALVLRQLTDLADTLDIGRVLLDFQRLDSPDNCAVAKALVTEAPCPVGVPAPYAKDLECPVFLPPVPPHIPLREHIVPWQGREIWLEAALGGEFITVTGQGSTISPLLPADIPETGLDDPAMHCHYRTKIYDDHIDFTLWRTREDLADLLREAVCLGVTLAVGLWQELN